MIDLNTLLNIAPPAILMIVLNGIGFCLKKANFFPNRIIPIMLLLLGGASYPFVGEYSPRVAAARFPVALMVVYGIGIGLAAVGSFESAKTLLEKKNNNPLQTNS